MYEQFKVNKRLLYFLIKEQILSLDSTIEENSDFFLTENTKSDKNNFNQNDELLKYYFDHLDEYEEKRRIGENDSFICSLIRQDSVEEFIQYVNKNNLPLSSKIKQSIFETNRFLIDKNPTLIEYAAFFGSIQIFQYLYLNKVDVDGSLWLYGIHSNNPDLLRNYIESNGIEPTDKTYAESLIESIKCHHNDIGKYIEDNLIDKSKSSSNENEEDNLIDKSESSSNENEEETKFEKHFFEASLKYQNYSFIPTEFGKSYQFFYLCKYNYQNIVDILIQSTTESIETLNKSNSFNSNFEASIRKASNYNEIDVIYFLFSSKNEIKDKFFQRNENLRRIAIPSSIKSIGNEAFSECSSLSHIVIPSSVTSIGKYVCHTL